MSSKRQDFVSLALAGKVMADEIDDYVDRWHDNPDNRPLHQYLGMEEEEYALWLSMPEALPIIITARKRGLNLGNFIINENEKTTLTSARSDDVLNIKRLQSWLEDRKRRSDVI